MKKLWVTVLFIPLICFFFAKPAYSEKIPDLQCGLRCHTNPEATHRKMNYQPECAECHSSGDIPVHVLEVGNENKKSISTDPMKKKIEYKHMVMIPAGEFIMGSNDRWDDESPQFIAKTDTYLIDINEVTNSQFKRFVDDTRYPPRVHWDDNEIPKGLEEHPVTYVSWTDASSYCTWSGKRLPTEAEWEKAARGKPGYTFPWGNEFDPSKSNSPESGNQGTKPVRSYESGKSQYGLYDMAGNVWEWTSDWYQPHPGNSIPNPKYGKKNRLTKGGSWFDCLEYGCGISAPSYNRGAFVPSTRNNTIGFRCAKDITR